MDFATASYVVLLLLAIVGVAAWMLRGQRDSKSAAEKRAEILEQAARNEESVRGMTREERKELWEKLNK